MITKDAIKLHLSQKYPGICLKWNEVQNFTDEQVVEEILDFTNKALNKSSIIDGIISDSDKQQESSLDPDKPFPQSGTWIANDSKRTALDLDELERKLDEALNNETPESLKQWLQSKRSNER